MNYLTYCRRYSVFWTDISRHWIADIFCNVSCLICV